MLRAQAAMKFLFVAVTIIGTVVGCGPSKSKDRPNPFVVDGVYDVRAVSLNCADGNRCTNSTGIILTISSTTENHGYYKTVTTSVSRCTGALYSPTQVLTAGHCTTSIGSGRTFFKTVATAGKPSQIFEVKGVSKSFYSESNSFSNDYASLELKSPAHGYDYVRSAAQISESLNEVTALVVNQPSDDNKVFQLDNVDCEVDVENMPLHVSAFPSVWGTKSCKLVGGNSGGPFFAKNNLIEVIGVLSKSTEAKMGGNNSFSQLLQLFNGNRPRPNLATAAHASCFDLPGWSKPDPRCQTLTDENAAEHIKSRAARSFKDSLVQITKELLTGPKAIIQVGNTRYKAFFVPVNTTVFDRQYQKRPGLVFLPLPFCVLSGSPTNLKSQLLNSIPYEVEMKSARLVPSTYPVTGSWSLSKIGSKWRAYVEIDRPFLFGHQVPPKRSTELRSEGMESSLSSCTGEEDETILSLYRNMDL